MRNDLNPKYPLFVPFIPSFVPISPITIPENQIEIVLVNRLGLKKFLLGDILRFFHSKLFKKVFWSTRILGLGSVEILVLLKRSNNTKIGSQCCQIPRLRQIWTRLPF